MDQKDIEILKALYSGNHLSDKERQRAKDILYSLHLTLENN